MAKSISELKAINETGDASKLDLETKFFGLPRQMIQDREGIFDRSVTYGQLMAYTRQVIAGQQAETPLDVDTPEADLAQLSARVAADSLVEALNKEHERAESIEGVDAEGGLGALAEGIAAESLVAALNKEHERAAGVEGDISLLETSAAESLVAAINSEHAERNAGIGDLAALPVIDTASAAAPEHLVAAIGQLLARLGAAEQENTITEQGLTDHRGENEPHANVIGLLADLVAPAENLVAALNALEVTHDITLEGQGKAGSELKVAAPLIDQIAAALQQTGEIATAFTTHETEPTAHGIDALEAAITEVQAKPGLDLPAPPAADGEYKLVVAGGVSTWASIV